MTFYEDIETDFILRTLKVLEQYDELKFSDEKEKFEVTLLVNSLLGLIIVPRETSLNTYLPNQRIELVNHWGLSKKQIADPDIKTVKELMLKLRNCVAHFQVSFENDENNNIQELIFLDEKNGEVARFKVTELREIINNIATKLLENYKQNKK
jgi:hypothetical protein